MQRANHSFPFLLSPPPSPLSARHLSFGVLILSALTLDRDSQLTRDSICSRVSALWHSRQEVRWVSLVPLSSNFCYYCFRQAVYRRVNSSARLSSWGFVLSEDVSIDRRRNVVLLLQSLLIINCRGAHKHVWVIHESVRSLFSKTLLTLAMTCAASPSLERQREKKEQHRRRYHLIKNSPSLRWDASAIMTVNVHFDCVVRRFEALC